MRGVGIDIIEIDRVRSVLQRHGARFTGRVFLDSERRYCASRRDPARHYAARFAAKEAVVKALAVRRAMTFLWRDIEILRNPDGAPGVRLTGRASEHARRRGITGLQVSLSHSDTHAVAMAAAD